MTKTSSNISDKDMSEIVRQIKSHVKTYIANKDDETVRLVTKAIYRYDIIINVVYVTHAEMYNFTSHYCVYVVK